MPIQFYATIHFKGWVLIILYSIVLCDGDVSLFHCASEMVSTLKAGMSLLYNTMRGGCAYSTMLLHSLQGGGQYSVLRSEGVPPLKGWGVIALSHSLKGGSVFYPILCYYTMLCSSIVHHTWLREWVSMLF